MQLNKLSKGNTSEAKRIFNSFSKKVSKDIGVSSNKEEEAMLVIENIKSFLISSNDKNLRRKQDSLTRHLITSIWAAMSSPDNSLSARALARLMGVTNKHMSMKGKQMRVAMEERNIKMTEHFSRKQQKRWDNFEEEIEQSIYDFCHDPNYVRPDNFSKQKYSCKDDHGLHCLHHRHNWFTVGTLEMQRNLYFESVHFDNLLFLLLVS